MALLFAGFVAVTLLFEHAETSIVPRDSTSSLNAQARGSKALFLLLQREGLRTDRLESPWLGLRRSDGLLVVVEPLSRERECTLEELKAAQSWVEHGGTVVDLLTIPVMDFNDDNPLTGDCAVVSGNGAPAEIHLDPAVTTPYLKQVGALVVASPVRLKLRRSSPYHVLFRDRDGILAVEKTVGKGKVLIVADSACADNAHIAQADNALFLTNIAEASIGASNRTVLFDEYHHGIGFSSHEEAADAGILANLPLPLRFTAWHLLGFGALLLYVGNRRFGFARTLPAAGYRASTDYVTSMARLLRRARASDVAVDTLYKNFVRVIRRQLNVRPDSAVQNLVPLAAAKWDWNAQALSELIARCEAISAGQRVDEMDSFTIARQIDFFLRSIHSVGSP